MTENFIDLNSTMGRRGLAKAVTWHLVIPRIMNALMVGGSTMNLDRADHTKIHAQSFRSTSKTG